MKGSAAIWAGLLATTLLGQGLAGEPQSDAPKTEAAAEASLDATTFDVRQWLATPLAPNPSADAVFAAWLAERDAILSGAQPPSLEWHAQVRAYQQTADSSDDPFVRELYHRVARDQYMRSGGLFSLASFSGLANRFGFTLSEEDAPALRDRVIRHTISTDIENTDFLQRELDARAGRWWRVSEVGTENAAKIWLLTQHADQTPEFQKRALDQMTPLLESGEVNRNNYAYLWDRVAMADGRLQRFGTQGKCVATGDWVALDMDASIEEVNQRRAAFDIETTFEENEARLDALCNDWDE